MSNVPKVKVHKDAKGRIILDEEKYVEVTIITSNLLVFFFSGYLMSL